MAKNGNRPGFLPSWRKGIYSILIFNLFMLAWITSVAELAAAEDQTKPDSAAPARPGQAQTQTHEIQVKDNAFTPARQVRVGDTISWVNLGKIPHTVTAKDHSFNTTLKPGQRFNLALGKQGTINYVCSQPGMFGVLMVGPAPTGASSTEALPRTLAAVSPVALTGVSIGWLLIIGLLTTAQLRNRSARRSH